MPDLQHDAGAEARRQSRACPRRPRADKRAVARPRRCRPDPRAHPAHRHAHGHRQARGAGRRAADGRRDRRERARAGTDQHPVRAVGSRSCWSPRPASACAADRCSRRSTARTSCAPSRSCWSRAAGTRAGGVDAKATHEHDGLRVGSGRERPPPARAAGDLARRRSTRSCGPARPSRRSPIRSPVDGYVIGEERGRRRRGAARDACCSRWPTSRRSG